MVQERPSSPRTSAVATFRAFTSVESEEEARRHLEESDWDLERAVSVYLDNDTTNTTPSEPRESEDVVRREVEVTPVTTVTAVTNRNRGNDLPRWLDALFSPLRLAWSLVSQLTQVVLRALGGPALAIEGAAGSNSQERFVSHFETNYGDVHPEFFVGSYRQALTKASEELKMMIVYLHSDAHRMTRQFCREVIADERFIEASEGCIFWGASVNQREGAAVMRGLRVHGLPFLGVVIWNGRVMEGDFGSLVAIRVGGGGGAEWLERVKRRQNSVLEGWRQERIERESARLLREEQDMEYARALEEDRKREREHEMERERVEHERRKQEEREQIRLRKMEELGEQVEKGPGVVSLALRLPDGKKVDRRFAGDEAMEKVFDWALVERVDLEVACLVSTWPRRRFVWPQDAEMTVTQAGLFPSAVLVLEERDDPQ